MDLNKSTNNSSKGCVLEVDFEAKGVNRNVAATISHNKYDDALFKNKCLRHSINTI